MILRRGVLEDLCGNAVVYWDVIGENIISPNSSIFAINFTVSSIPLDNKLLTATFPPIPFLDYNELADKLANVHCDIIYGGELQFPIEQDAFNQFYKSEFAKFNKVIEKYVDLYKEKFNFRVTKLTEHEKLNLLKDLSKKVRIGFSNRKKENKLFSKRILKIINNLKNQSKYDVAKFRSVLFKPGLVEDELVQLYTSQFLAIYHENYEHAGVLKQKITQLESNLSQTDSYDYL